MHAHLKSLAFCYTSDKQSEKKIRNNPTYNSFPKVPKHQRPQLVTAMLSKNNTAESMTIPSQFILQSPNIMNSMAPAQMDTWVTGV